MAGCPGTTHSFQLPLPSRMGGAHRHGPLEQLGQTKEGEPCSRRKCPSSSNSHMPDESGHKTRTNTEKNDTSRFAVFVLLQPKKGDGKGRDVFSASTAAKRLYRASSHRHDGRASGRHHGNSAAHMGHASTRSVKSAAQTGHASTWKGRGIRLLPPRLQNSGP